MYQKIENSFQSSSIIGLVVEFIVAIDEARVRFTDDAIRFLFWGFLLILFYSPSYLIRDCFLSTGQFSSSVC